MKASVRNEYLRRVRKILESKLNSGNLINGINTWAVSLLRYSASFLEWRVDEMKELDRRTRKLLTMHGAHNPNSDVDRLYLPRKLGGRGLLSIKDTVDISEAGLRDYVLQSTEPLIVAARTVIYTNMDEFESATVLKRRLRVEKLEKFRLKPLHGQFFRQIGEVSRSNEWQWMKDGSLKRGTEALICAAQEQALRTNYIKSKIDKSQENSKCRLCFTADETANHILSECPKLAQKEYLRRHNWVGKRVHWEISKIYGFPVGNKWYEHDPEKVIENDDHKILWDFTLQTDHVIEARRPDLVILNKKEKVCKIIDFAVPADSRVVTKELEKIEKYQDLARELRKIWNVKCEVIPIVVGSLGTVTDRFKMWLQKIDIDIEVKEIQKTTLLNSARILRKVLEM